MAKLTDNEFYLLMYRHSNGVTNYWALFDSLEAAAQDGPLCYKNQAGVDLGSMLKAEMVRRLLKYEVFSDQFSGLTLWIDTVPLYTQTK